MQWTAIIDLYEVIDGDRVGGYSCYLSKSYAITGWDTGFIARDSESIYKQNKPIVPIPLNSHMLSTRKSKIGQMKMIINKF